MKGTVPSPPAPLPVGEGGRRPGEGVVESVLSLKSIYSAISALFTSINGFPSSRTTLPEIVTYLSITSLMIFLRCFLRPLGDGATSSGSHGDTRTLPTLLVIINTGFGKYEGSAWINSPVILTILPSNLLGSDIRSDKLMSSATSASDDFKVSPAGFAPEAEAFDIPIRLNNARSEITVR